MISVHFSERPVRNFADAAAANNALFISSSTRCSTEVFILPPSAYETWFVSHAIGDAEINATAARCRGIYGRIDCCNVGMLLNEYYSLTSLS